MYLLKCFKFMHPYCIKINFFKKSDPKLLKKMFIIILFFSWHMAKYGDPYSEFVLCI